LKIILLNDLLRAAGLPASLHNPEISSIAYDSRTTCPGSIFVAIPGLLASGLDYTTQAIEKGAVAIVSESALPDIEIPQIVVTNARMALADLAGAFFENPANSLKCVGITGTNGKTTTAFLVKHILDTNSLHCGLIGTVKYVIGQTEIPAPRTTPEASDLQALLGQMRDGYCRAVAMEVSSHALAQHRTRGIAFDAAVFTNLTQDHLDYHGSMDAYFEAKALLFEGLAEQREKKGRAIVNCDDRYGHRLMERYAKRTKLVTFGQGANADFRASDIRFDAKGGTFQLEARNKNFLVRMPLIGLFNVYNALGALAAATACGLELRHCVAALADAPQVPGRLERVPSRRNFQTFVDYAHTEDALRNVLSTLRQLRPTRLITVFGCGGDRDRAKRPLMAAAAAQGSDLVVLTSDNPRREDPEQILRDTEVGLKGCIYDVIADRAKAICHAIEIAGPGDIVLLAGKGHETTQEINSEKYPFNDVLIATRAIAEKKGEA